jgi:DNA-binding NarL/FixJ family response regulator
MEGKKYISPSLADALVDGLKGEQHTALHEGLSNREYQVLCMIASGKPVGKIAGELSLSVKTISTYRAHVLKKMHMGNNAELTRYAIENGLV